MSSDTSRLPPQLAARPRTRRVEVPGGPLAYLERRPVGTARGVVLGVPGFTGSKEDLTPLLGPLSRDGWHAVAMDLRGQFESPGPDDEAAYTVARLGADLVHVAATFAGPVHLVAHSFGGLVSRAAVLQAPPGTFASLVLLASGPCGGGLLPARTGPMGLMRPAVEATGMAGTLAAIKALRAQDPTFVPPVPQLAAFLDERWLASTAAGLLGMGDALLAEPDRTDALAAHGLPVLVVHGEHDDAWPPHLQGEMAQRLGSRRVVIADAAHAPAVEATDATVAALLEWLDQHG